MTLKCDGVVCKGDSNLVTCRSIMLKVVMWAELRKNAPYIVFILVGKSHLTRDFARFRYVILYRRTRSTWAEAPASNRRAKLCSNSAGEI